MFRRTGFFFACLALALQVLPAGMRPAAAQPAPYVINTILALTGPAAFIGGSEKQALGLSKRSSTKAAASKAGR